MYKLMIVDDEQIVIDAVKYIIDKNLKSVEVADAAKSGREAIEKAKQQQVDIILMDISMPGINGLDAIKEIKQYNPHIRFVIISAYEQFEFAKQALELGVGQYVLKPINKMVLINIINKITQQIEDEKKKQKRDLETLEKLEKIIPYLEQGFIYSILLNTEFNEELNRYMELLDLKNPGGYIMIVQLGEGERANQLKNRIGSSITLHKVYPYIRDLLKYKCRCIVGPVMINKTIVYIPSDSFNCEYDFRLKTIEFAEEFLKSIQKKTDIEIFIGIGGYKNNKDIVYSYNEAVKALRNNRGERISHIFDMCNTQLPQIHDTKELDSIVSRMEMGDQEGAAANFARVVDRVSTIDEQIVDYLRNMILELMVMVHRKAIEAGVEEDSYLKYNEYIIEMLSIKDSNKLVIWCINRIKYLTGRMQERRDEEGNYIIGEAKKFIDKNFVQDLTLKDVSKNFNISPQYFSKLFKEETGYNFIEYLTFVRMEQAKRLMSNKDVTIKEICYDIGYGDPNYFSRLFKKNTGMSPTDYINKNKY